MVPDVFSEGLADGATVGHDPARYARQTFQQANGLWQFMRLSRCQAEGNGTAGGIGDHAGFRSITATRSAKCFTRRTSSSVALF